MGKQKYVLDMTKGSIFKNTIRFAIPLMFASFLQLFYNAADLVIVSRYAGSGAMASVGATSSLTNLLINIFVGLSVGASVVVSRKFGAHKIKEMERAIHTSMLLGLMMGIIAGIIGFIFSKPLLILMGTPEGEVLDGAVLYMRILFLGVPASLAYNFGASVLRALGDTKRPLYILAIAGLVNVFLNLVLVIVFDMSVAGVAIATAVSNYLSMIAVLVIMTHSQGEIKLNWKKLKLYPKELKEILQIGIPAGIQSSFFALSNTVIQSSVNRYGDAAVAGNAAASNLDGFIYVAMNAFYQATLTGVSQNYGARSEKRVNKTIWISMLSVSVVGLALGTLCVVFARPLLRFYITDSAMALEYGVKRMVVTCSLYLLCGIMEVLIGALRGLGCSIATAVTAFIGSCGFRIFWVAVVIERLSGGIEKLYFCWPISWAMVIVMQLVILAIVKPRAMRHMRHEIQIEEMLR